MFWRLSIGVGESVLLITDTAVFRYPHYHRRSDTPDKIDYDRMVRVVSGINRVILDLANGG